MSTPPPTGGSHPTYPGPMATKYLTLDQAAQRAGIPPAQLEEAFRQGQVLGAAYSADQRWAITEEALDAWLANPT